MAIGSVPSNCQEIAHLGAIRLKLNYITRWLIRECSSSSSKLEQLVQGSCDFRVPLSAVYETLIDIVFNWPLICHLKYLCHKLKWLIVFFSFYIYLWSICENFSNNKGGGVSWIIAPINETTFRADFFVVVYHLYKSFCVHRLRKSISTTIAAED